MGKESIEKLLAAISYPDRAGVEGNRAVLMIDENEVVVEAIDRYLRFSTVLETGDGELADLAGYVPGRIYKDSATLSVDAEGKAFLWQDELASQDERRLGLAFESCLNSCDWWRARIDADRADSGIRFQDVLIRP